MNINSEDQKHNIDRLFSTKSNEQCEDSTSKNDLIEEANFDQLLKAHFERFEQNPSKDVWQKVEKELPLNLYIKTYLNWLSKVAAILVLGMFAVYLFVEIPAPNDLADQTTLNTPSLTELNSDYIAKEEEKEAFVFHIPKQLKKEPSLTKVFSEEDNSLLEKADEILASILIDTNEFSEEINAEKMAEILLPIEQLPIENKAAVIEKKERHNQTAKTKKNSFIQPEEEIEIHINIPLRVVEEDEIEDLLNYYEQYTKSKNQ